MKHYLWILLIGLFSLSQGCLDPIDFDVPAMERETLVIQGKLVKGEPSVVEVVVNRLFDFTAASRLPVTVRSVELIDEDGNIVELEATSTIDYVATIEDNDPRMTIDYGRSYQIRVSTFDNRVFISDLEPLLPAPQPDQLSFSVGTALNDSTLIEEDVLNIFINTGLRSELTPGQKSKLRWEVEVVYEVDDDPDGQVEPKTCWIATQAELSDIKTIDGDELTNESIENFLIANLKVGPNYAKGVYVNVYQESLTESSLKYWEQVGELVQRSGNMFEAPVGKLVTNFRNANEGSVDEIFGYFYTTEQKVTRIYIDPSDVGNPTPNCPYTGMRSQSRDCNQPLVCCDCLRLPNSTVIKPEYWVK
jgi:hypothetical protein